MARSQATEDYQRQCAIWVLRILIEGQRLKGRAKRTLGSVDVNTRQVVGLSTCETLSLATLDQRLSKLTKRGPARMGPLFVNVDLLGAALGLSEVERDLLALAWLIQSTPGVAESFELCAPLSWRETHRLIAVALESSPTAVEDALGRKSVLSQARLVVRGSPGRYDRILQIPEHFEGSLQAEHDSLDSLLATMFRASPAAELTLDDYPHLAADLDLLVPLLAAATGERTSGFDVLIHGAPGTGKSELCRVVARAVDATLYEVAVEDDDDGCELKRNQRLASWALAQRILSQKPDVLVLFDEAEDAFPRGNPMVELFGLPSRAAGGKGWMNRALETHPVTTFWVANNVSQIDPAFLRRFDVILEVRAPPPSVRRRVLDRHLADLPVRDAWRNRAARDNRLAPAHIGRAARAVRLLGARSAEATEAAFDRILGPQLAAVGPATPAAPLSCGSYDLSLVNSDMPIEPLVAALAGRPRGTVCLHGPPGTGKSAFVAHLAERTGRPLRIQRASDLLGMYVGQTEKAIAAMFREARDDGAVLFLDEADSFLQDRARAQRSWEVTQVNELLTQMERHDGLFVCATNLLETLDQASLRRFAIKIRFDPLRLDQRILVLRAVLAEFGLADPHEVEVDVLRSRLERLDSLTVGDFAAVSRQWHMLGGRSSPSDLVAALEAEVRLKQGPSSRSVGFRSER